MSNTAPRHHRKPQKNGAIIHDPSVTVVTIWTEDGNSVVMTPTLARDMALDILKITCCSSGLPVLPVGKDMVH